MRLSGTRTRYRNWLNRRAWNRGKTPLPDRIARQFTSRMPVYRNRVNRGTGRPHRDDRWLGGIPARAMAGRAARHPDDRAGAPAARPAGNRSLRAERLRDRADQVRDRDPMRAIQLGSRAVSLEQRSRARRSR